MRFREEGYHRHIYAEDENYNIIWAFDIEDDSLYHRQEHDLYHREVGLGVGYMLLNEERICEYCNEKIPEFIYNQFLLWKLR